MRRRRHLCCIPYFAETLAYWRLNPSATPAQILAINNYVRQIKLGSGVTLASVTAKLSLVNGTPFVTQVSQDLRWLANTGWKVTFTNASNSAYLLAGAAGTGETYGSNPFAPFNFTSGFSTSGATVSDADTFVTAGGAGGLYKDGIFIAGKLYKAKVVGSVTSGTLSINSVSAGVNNRVQIAAAGAYGYHTGIAGNTYIYLRNSAASTTDVSSIEVLEITAPDATGFIGSTNWTISGITGGEASYTVTITRS